MTQVKMPKMEIIMVYGHSDAALQAYGDARAKEAREIALEDAAKIVEASPSYDWHKFACESATAIRALKAKP